MTIKKTVSFCPLSSYENFGLMVESIFGASKSEVKKVISNKIAWVRDQKQQLKEFMEQKTPVYYNQVRPDGYSVDEEKWTDNFEELQKQAGEALKHLEKIEESLK